MPENLLKRRKDVLIFDLCIVTIALILFLGTIGLNLRSWLFPGLFSLILLFISGTQTLADLYPEQKRLQFIARQSQAKKEDIAIQEDIDRGKHARVGLIILSMLAFYLVFRFSTIYLSIPLLCILLLGFLNKRPWPTVALVAVSLDISIYVIFNVLFRIAL